MWTPTALASNVRQSKGLVWRVVEHQYTVSTRKIVDTQDEQDLLEDILEESKPPYPLEALELHYLLKTPFRYCPPNPYGSRFRRANSGSGVFYASEHIRCALAEFSYYRIRFFQASPETPFPQNQVVLTVFSVKYQSAHLLDLLQPPLSRDHALWTDKDNYTASQLLADSARQANIEVIRYESVRDVEKGANIALLVPQVFTTKKPVAQQTWYFFLSTQEASCIRVNPHDSSEKWIFPLTQFA